MIKVEYLPFSTNTPLPDPTKTEWVFESHADFKQWVQNYVCIHCLVDFYDLKRQDPKTLDDWLTMGCGCEIDVTDEENEILWDDLMTLPENYATERDNYVAMMIDAFDRHG